MQHLVLLPFISNELGILVMPNSYFDCKDYSKVKKLEELGLIKANDKVETLKPTVKKTTSSPKHTRKKASE